MDEYQDAIRAANVKRRRDLELEKRLRHLRAHATLLGDSAARQDLTTALERIAALPESRAAVAA